MKGRRCGGFFSLLLAWWFVAHSQVFSGHSWHRDSGTRLRQQLQEDKARRLRHELARQAMEDAKVPEDFPNLYQLAEKAAQQRNMPVMKYLHLLNDSATGFILSGDICDRVDLKVALTQAMSCQGQLTLVIGGKNVGKSTVLNFTARELEWSKGSRLTIYDIDMRDTPSKPLYEALLERMIQVSPNAAKVFTSVIAVATGLNLPDATEAPAKAALAGKTVGEVVQEGLKLLGAFPAVVDMEKTLCRIMQEIRTNGNTTVFVVDEANIALPAAMDPGATLAFITWLTKQTRKATVVLVTSEFAYPYKLAAAGLALVDIDRVILAGEVPKEDMLQLLTQRWNMSPELAAGFFAVYGGHIHFTHRGICRLIDQVESFDPLTVLDCPGLQTCINDPQARQHLINIAKKGFSPILDKEADKGGKLIEKASVGGVIKKGTITFGLPADMWSDGDHEYVAVPSHHVMRLAIIKKLQRAPPIIITPPDQVILNITHQGTSAQVVFKKGDSGAAIKKAIRLAIGVPFGSLLRLKDKAGRDVAITGGLDPGDYEVLVARQERWWEWWR